MNSDELSQPKSIQFQLIPVSENPKKKAIGEVIERKIQEGVVLSIGRQVIKDGQPVIKGSKPASEDNIWFNSKVVSRNHAELWMKDYQIYIRDIGSSSGTFLNKMRLSPSGKESRPYAITQGDIIQLGIDFKGKNEDIYKGIIVKIGFHDQSWIKASRNQANHIKYF
jgi:pSer/pThr/pTyr-binding forkhead associated (FHA) protein